MDNLCRLIVNADDLGWAAGRDRGIFRSARIQFKIKTESTLQRLDKSPNSGRTLPEFPDLPHRELIVKPYRFFYRIVHNTIWIVALWHGAQLPQEPS